MGPVGHVAQLVVQGASTDELGSERDALVLYAGDHLDESFGTLAAV